MRTLFFDCFAGASGNMVLGALIDLGLDRELLFDRIKGLGLAGYEIEIEKVDRSGISSTHLNVVIPVEKNHRHLHHIVDIIENSNLSEGVKARSVAIFDRLAAAEARVHGISVKKVHFHEVGAMDAIIDVVGACIAFEMLGIENFACSKIHVGSGFVDMEHGRFPVPPPAVAELLVGKPIYSTDIAGELITPTGAAIISTVCDSYGVIPEMAVERTGYGAGSRIYDGFPNVLRIMIGETIADKIEQPQNRERLVILESNIDDLSPQIIGHVMDRAFELGASDCWFTPIQMKKNRPATLISILCRLELRSVLTDLLFKETSTLGIRFRDVDREALDRELVDVQTAYGQVKVKIGRHNGVIVNVMPEYDDVVRVAKENGVSLRAVHNAVSASLASRAALAAG
ncbi:MAG TPA: nickel pincer cofactor biosynthesis protein LarC [Pyrinomonadaceae bacterium]|nr:nickel pincer cofactor biosynthesis protein LarC [Chloracidobacterium sp.]HRJ89439.1 nickel pincer cofactor biosynthesis protein LarC [Pyrinomonadaceae bacterium]HRK51626.1 nickel pincer cofactor biosynthesis protein LarC [Pyrinomonadaceae bacterium]